MYQSLARGFLFLLCLSLSNQVVSKTTTSDNDYDDSKDSRKGENFILPYLIDQRLLNPKGANTQDQLSQLCDHAKKEAGDKKFALILLKTHMCDAGTAVCIRSLRSVSDLRNTFIHDNFVT